MGADGVHFSNSLGGSVLVRHRCATVQLLPCVCPPFQPHVRLPSHSTFEGQGDDGMNIPTIFMDIESVSADRTVLTLGKDGAVQARLTMGGERGHPLDDGQSCSSPLQDPAGILWPGSTMNLFARETLLPAGTAVVAKIAGTSLVLTAPLPAGVGQWDLVNNAASYADYVEVWQWLHGPRGRFGPDSPCTAAGV